MDQHNRRSEVRSPEEVDRAARVTGPRIAVDDPALESTDNAEADSAPEYLDGVIEYGTADSSERLLAQHSILVLDESVDRPVRLVLDGRVVAEGSLVRDQNRIGIRIGRLVDETPLDATPPINTERNRCDAA